MVGVIEGRTDEFCHPGIKDGELPRDSFLYVKHSRYQCASRSDNAASRFEMDCLSGIQVEMAGKGFEIAFEIGDGQMVGMLVIDSKPSSYIEVSHRKGAALEP